MSMEGRKGKEKIEKKREMRKRTANYKDELERKTKTMKEEKAGKDKNMHRKKKQIERKRKLAQETINNIIRKKVSV